MPVKTEPKTSGIKMPPSMRKEEPKAEVPKVPVKAEPKAETKTVHRPESAPPEDDGSKPEEKFDFSEVNPETDWECFGQIEPEHPECKDCPFKVKCAAKAGKKL